MVDSSFAPILKHRFSYQIHAMMGTPMQKTLGETAVIGIEKCLELVETLTMLISSPKICVVYAKVISIETAAIFRYAPSPATRFAAITA